MPTTGADGDPIGAFSFSSSLSAKEDGPRGGPYRFNPNQMCHGSTVLAEVGSTVLAEVGSTELAEVGSTELAEVGSTELAEV